MRNDAQICVTLFNISLYHVQTISGLSFSYTMSSGSLNGGKAGRGRLEPDDDITA